MGNRIKDGVSAVPVAKKHRLDRRCWSRLPLVFKNVCHHSMMNAVIVGKRTRVVSTILVLSSVAAVMLLVLGRISRNNGSTTAAAGKSIVANAHATTATSTTTAVTSAASPRRVHRILTYGDSLTAGTSGNQLFPYAVYLEQALLLQQRNGSNNDNNAGGGGVGTSVVVRHRGMPGWTTQAMLDDLDGDRTGLRSAIQAVRDPPLSLVILLAGTNDLGHGFTVEEITQNLKQLHTVCHENGVARTIAIGIPPSGYQAQNEKAAALAAAINSNLQQFAEQQPSKTSYMPFPFPFERGGENWFSDTLHFSERGYKVLGESLAPVVEQILQSLDDAENEEAS